MLDNFIISGLRSKTQIKKVKHLLSFLILSSSAVMLHAHSGPSEVVDYINIPDSAFKARLLSNNEINTNGDSEIQISEALAFRGKIDADNLGITDLTGIEAFINITELFAVNNNITSVNVSKNMQLVSLYLDQNKLTNLDVSKLTKLRELSFYNNAITSLDLTNNTALGYLDFDNNKVTNIDLTKNIKLYLLYASSNPLTSLDVSKNVELSTIWVNSANLTTLDLTKNVNLFNLELRNNQLTSLDVSKNTMLFNLALENNKISSLNLTLNKSLENINVKNNSLQALNVKNGNNIYIANFDATSNINLLCINVDNANGSRNGWFKDSAAAYSTDCVTLGVTDLDKKVGVYPNPVQSVLNISEVSDVDVYTVTGQKVGSYTNVSTINMNHLLKGSYIVVLKDKAGKETKSIKVIKN